MPDISALSSIASEKYKQSAVKLFRFQDKYPLISSIACKTVCFERCIDWNCLTTLYFNFSERLPFEWHTPWMNSLSVKEGFLGLSELTANHTRS